MYIYMLDSIGVHCFTRAHRYTVLKTGPFCPQPCLRAHEHAPSRAYPHTNAAPSQPPRSRRPNAKPYRRDIRYSQVAYFKCACRGKRRAGDEGIEGTWLWSLGGPMRGDEGPWLWTLGDDARLGSRELAAEECLESAAIAWSCSMSWSYD